MARKKSPSVAPAPKGPRPPPCYVPKQAPVRPVERNFYADPFDPRFVEGTAERKHTPLGAMLQCFGFMRTRLLEMCPDAVAFIEDNSLE